MQRGCITRGGRGGPPSIAPWSQGPIQPQDRGREQWRVSAHRSGGGGVGGGVVRGPVVAPSRIGAGRRGRGGQVTVAESLRRVTPAPLTRVIRAVEVGGEERRDGRRRGRVRESVLRSSTPARVCKKARHVASSHIISRAVKWKVSVRSAPQHGPPTEALTAKNWSPMENDKCTARLSPHVERVRSDTVSARHNVKRPGGTSQYDTPPQPDHDNPLERGDHTHARHTR